MRPATITRALATAGRVLEGPPFSWATRFIEGVAAVVRAHPWVWIPFGALVTGEWMLLYLTGVVGR